MQKDEEMQMEQGSKETNGEVRGNGRLVEATAVATATAAAGAAAA